MRARNARAATAWLQRDGAPEGSGGHGWHREGASGAQGLRARLDGQVGGGELGGQRLLRTQQRGCRAEHAARGAVARQRRLGDEGCCG
jgi:hypothetical protein